ncbi:MAG: hypothetical protein KDD53_02805 [Bdellovibrionales bacterium]|nr:hypothetical protein [Bdellovibrionales bacterium]
MREANKKSLMGLKREALLKLKALIQDESVNTEIKIKLLGEDYRSEFSKLVEKHQLHLEKELSLERE